MCCMHVRHRYNTQMLLGMKIAFTKTFLGRIADCRCIAYEAHKALEVFGLRSPGLDLKFNYQ